MAAQYDVPAWGGSIYSDVTVPSGGTILAKRLDFTDIIAAGLMNEFDSLSPVAEEKVIGPANGKRPADRQPKRLTKAQETKAQADAAKAQLADVEGMANLAKILSLVIPLVVVKPEITSNLERDGNGNWVPVAPDARDASKIYVDSIPLGDRMFILTWSMEGMDMKSLESFRGESEPDLGAVEPVAESPDSAV